MAFHTLSSRNAPPYKRLLRTNPHSFSIFKKVFALRLRYSDSSNHSFTYIGAPFVNDRTIKIVVVWDKPQQQQASWANVMHNMDVLIKLPGIGSGNRSSIFYKITFFLISPLECLVFTCTTTQWAHPAHEIHHTCHYMCTLNEEPTDLGKSRRPITTFFSLGTFLTA